jgi:ATP-dependent Clp protease adapter protein ClpS
VIAQELEVCLHQAFVNARQERHEQIGLEQLLLELLQTRSGLETIRAAGAKPEELRKALADHVAQHARRIPPDKEPDTLPTLGFQRALQRAIFHVQSSGRKEVTPVDLVAAIVDETDSLAGRLLEQHGVKPLPEGGDAPQLQAAAETSEEAPASPGSAIAQELEVILHVAFVDAREKRHEFITAEHLLLGLLDATDVAKALRACGVDQQGLRNKLREHLDAHIPGIPADREVDTAPSLGFQRVIQRAILHRQRFAIPRVSAMDTLVALFGEKDSRAVELLARHGISRYEAVFYQTHGVAPNAPSSEAPAPEGAELQVLIYNDDYTPMEFVVQALQKFFSMSSEDAKETMLEVHRQGAAVCGLYEREAALDLVKRVAAHAREHGHPLNCVAVAPGRE